MNPFTISIPLAGEAISAFKSVSDVFSIVEKDNEKINLIDDDTVQFSMPITFGSFRLLLDGEFEIIDRDLDAHVAIYKLISKDRGGKGKLDSNFRLWLEESSIQSNLKCLVEVKAKGMISRVDLPIEEVLTNRIEKLVGEILADSPIEIFVEEPELKIDTVPAEIGSQHVTDYKTPLWVAILKFPSKVFTFPFNFFRALLGV